MLPRIAYASSVGVDPEQVPALEGLRGARLDPVALPWDEPVDWDDFDLVLVVGARDCFTRRQEFLRWARAVEDVTTLANPVRMLVRNTDRLYLRDLARRGVPTVDSEWFEAGDDPHQYATALRERAWSSLRVLPGVVGAPPAVTRDPEEAAAQAARFAAQGWSALVQPAREQTLSVVLLCGEPSYAVLRTAGAQAQPVEIPEQVMESLLVLREATSDDEELLYARADLVHHEQSWQLAEFAVAAPRLFLEVVPGAADRLGAAVRRALSPATVEY